MQHVREAFFHIQDLLLLKSAFVTDIFSHSYSYKVFAVVVSVSGKLVSVNLFLNPEVV